MAGKAEREKELEISGGHEKVFFDAALYMLF
jgi:hypothetical protein